MKHFRFLFLTGLMIMSAVILSVRPVVAQAAPKDDGAEKDTRVTIYNARTGMSMSRESYYSARAYDQRGYWSNDGNSWIPIAQAKAYVKDRRKMNFPQGNGKVQFKDVAQQIDVTSVFFKSIDNPKDVEIAEQNYEYDLVSAAKIMEKYIDQEIEIITKDGVVKGILMSFDGSSIVIKDKDTGNLSIVERQDNVKSIKFPGLPDGLITRPTLVWDVSAKTGGTQMAEVSYLTGGVDWQTDYVAVLNENDTKMDFGAWVTIRNSSGVTFENAKMKLVAGDVSTSGMPLQQERTMDVPPEMAGQKPELAKGTKGRKLFEYYLYDLERRTTVKNNQIKQISLFPTVKDVPVVKYYLYDGSLYGKKVRTNVKFLNSQGNNLGISLPMGRVRVSKMDEDKALEFIGEDSVDHTAKDEEVDVFLGNAFDITGEWKHMDTKKIAANVWELSYEIKLRNHKDENAKVIVREHAWGGEWDIVKSNELFKNYKKKDAHRMECEVEVPKGGDEVILTYTIRYTW